MAARADLYVLPHLCIYCGRQCISVFMGSISSWSHFLIVNCCEHWHISLVFELHSKKFIASVSSNLTSLQFCLFHWYWIALAITANCSTCLFAVFKEILEECYNCVPIIIWMRSATTSLRLKIHLAAEEHGLCQCTF